VSGRCSIDDIVRSDSVIIMYEPIVCSTDSDIIYIITFMCEKLVIILFFTVGIFPVTDNYILSLV